MMYHFNVTGDEKKRMIQTISDAIGVTAKYLGVPSCAYQIGNYQVSKDGTLSWNDLDDADPQHLDQSVSLIQRLEFAGFHSEEAKFFQEQQAAMEEAVEEIEEEDHTEEEPEEMILTISVPRRPFSEEDLDNLRNLIQAKGTLMKHAFGAEKLDIILEEDKVSFPWFSADAPDEVEAYTKFVEAIGRMVRDQKRISAKEKEVENEKYAFRCFLLRLGFIGQEHKKARKILLKNLTGSAAFKQGKKKGGVEDAIS